MVTVVLGHPVHVFRRTVNFSLYSFYCSYMVAHPQPNSYFSIRASETAARSFFRSRGYYCLMKLSSWFVIFLLRLSSLSLSALHRQYALWSRLRCIQNIFQYFNIVEIVGTYCNRAIQSRTKTFVLMTARCFLYQEKLR